VKGLEVGLFPGLLQVLGGHDRRVFVHAGRVNVALENEKGNSESNEFDFDFHANRRWNDDFLDQPDQELWGPAWWLTYE
jgi:hypothetical protein